MVQEVTRMTQERHESPRAMAELQRKEAIKEQVLAKVKSGEDRVGNTLFQMHKDMIVRGDPDKARRGSTRDVARGYQEAVEFANKLNKPGVEPVLHQAEDAARLMVTLKGLYKQAGLGEYNPAIEVEEGMKESEKQRLLQEQLKKDLINFPDNVTDHKLQRYVEAVTTREFHKEQLQAACQGDLARDKIRQQAYRMQRAQNRVNFEVDAATPTTVNANERALLHPRPETLTQEAFVPLEDRTPEEQQDRVKERLAAYKEELKQRYGGKVVETFDSLSPGDRSRFAFQLINSEGKIWQERQMLVKAVEVGDPEEICDLAAQIKSGELKHKTLQTELDGQLAATRKANSTTEWSQSWQKMTMAFSKGEGGEEAMGNVVQATKEVIAAHLHSANEWWRQKLAPIRQTLDAVGQDISETIQAALNMVDENLKERMLATSTAIGVEINDRYESVVANTSRAMTILERGRINARVQYYEARHASAVGWQRYKAELGAYGTAEKAYVSHDAAKIFYLGGRLLGVNYSEEDKASLTARPEEIRQQWGDDLTKRFDDIENKYRENPHFRKLLEPLMHHVREVAPEPEIPPMTVTPELDKEADAVVEALKNNDQQVLSMVDGQIDDVVSAIERNLQPGVTPDWTGVGNEVRTLERQSLALWKIHHGANANPSLRRFVNDYLQFVTEVDTLAHQAVNSQSIDQQQLAKVKADLTRRNAAYQKLVVPTT